MRKSLQPLSRCFVLVFILALASLGMAQRLPVLWQTVGAKGTDASFSSNGAYMATVSQYDVKIYRTSTWQLIQTIGFSRNAAVSGAEFTSGPSARLYISYASSVYSCTAEGLDFRHEFDTAGNILAMDVAEDASMVACLIYSAGSNLMVRDLVTNTDRFTAWAPGNNDLHISPDNSQVVVNNGPDTYSATTGALIADRSLITYPHFEVTPDGEQAIGLFGSGLTGRMRCIDLDTGAIVYSKPINLTGYNGGVFTLAANGTRVLIPLFTGTAFIAQMFKTTTGFDYGGFDLGWSSTAYPFLVGSPTNNRVYVASGQSTGIDPIRGDIYGFETFSNTMTFLTHITTLYYTPRHLTSAILNNFDYNAQLMVTASGQSWNPNLDIRNALTGESLASAAITITQDLDDDYDQRLAFNWTGTQLILNAKTVFDTGSFTTYGSIAHSGVSAAFHDNDDFSVSCTADRLRAYNQTGGGAFSTIADKVVVTSKLITVDVSGNRAYTVAADPRSMMQTDYVTGIKKTVVVAGAGGFVRFLQVSTNNLLYVGYENSGDQQGTKIYDISGDVPVLLRNITRITLAPGTGTNHKAWAVDWDGDILAMATTVVNTGAPGEPRFTGNFAYYQTSTGNLLASYDNEHVGWGYEKLAFSSDGSVLTVARRDPALLGVAVPIIVRQLTLNPNFIEVSGDVEGTVTLTRPAPVGGKRVILTSNRSALVVPPSVTVPAGATQATFIATYTGVAVQTDATVTAKTAPATARATVTLSP
ncbi:MAG: hypothetical protein ACAH95_00500 [Fimbriimonas sp.]